MTRAGRAAAVLMGLAVAAAGAMTLGAAAQAPAGAATGSLRGRVKLNGEPPGNRVIRMGMDPMCAKMWAGKKPGPVDEVVATSDDGGLMNVFVKLDGVVSRERRCRRSPSCSIRRRVSTSRASSVPAWGRSCASGTATTCCTTSTAARAIATASTSGSRSPAQPRLQAGRRGDAEDRLRSLAALPVSPASVCWQCGAAFAVGGWTACCRCHRRSPTVRIGWTMKLVAARPAGVQHPGHLPGRGNRDRRDHQRTSHRPSRVGSSGSAIAARMRSPCSATISVTTSSPRSAPIDAHKVRVIPNFVLTDQIRPMDRLTAYRRELGIGDETGGALRRQRRLLAISRSGGACGA